MKKMTYIGLIAVILIVITSCSRGNEQYESGQLTTYHFIHDLDYLLHTLEENFALFDVAYWARGVDIRVLTENARTAILETDQIRREDFYRIMSSYFRNLNSIAHFRLSPPEGIGRWDYVHESMPHETVDISKISSDILDADDIEDIYRRFTNLRTELFSGQRLAVEQFYSNVMNNFPSIVGNDLAEDMFYSHIYGDFKLLIRVMEAFHLAVEGAITTNIIEEGRIAYIAPRCFLIASMSSEAAQQYERQVLDFLNQISGYEHLIVDLRGHMGGVTNFFFNNIVRPTAGRTLRAKGYAFVQNGRHISTSPLHIMPPMGGIPIDREFIPVHELLEYAYLPELNIQDMERMDYSFRFQLTVAPGGPQLFDGKIWLLASTGIGSAAQIITWFVEETGFATIVGDITGGNYGGLSTHMRLPYTNLLVRFDQAYVTNSRGRPLEAGTIPNHFTRPRMDALETTLALIAEGCII